mgnify:CR=1 FL=1
MRAMSASVQSAICWKLETPRPPSRTASLGPTPFSSCRLSAPVLGAGEAGFVAGGGGTVGSSGMAVAAFAGAGLATFLAAGLAALVAGFAAGFAAGSFTVVFFAAGFAAVFGFAAGLGAGGAALATGSATGAGFGAGAGSEADGAALATGSGAGGGAAGVMLVGDAPYYSRFGFERLKACGFGGDDFGFYRFERFRGFRRFDDGRCDVFGFRASEQPPQQHDGNDEADDRDNPVFLKPNHDLLRL